MTDNEENALTAVRILFDLQKSLRNIKCVQCQTNRADAVLRRNGSCTLCWTCAEAEFARKKLGDDMSVVLVRVCLRDKVQAFLNIVQEIDHNLGANVKTFEY